MKFPKVKLSHAPAGPNAFRRMVDSCELAVPGDVVAVYDKHGSPYGLALYNPKSQIMLRNFTRDNPETFDIDAFLKKQVTKAVSFRRDILGLERSADVFRLVHDYGDGLPGLTADIYAEHIVLEFYSLGMYKLAPRLETAFREHFPKAVFHHRASSYTQEMEGFSLPPDASAVHKTRVRENGVLFDVGFSGGHKTGFFCDQRENRLYASTFAAGKSVLDICA